MYQMSLSISAFGPLPGLLVGVGLYGTMEYCLRVVAGVLIFNITFLGAYVVLFGLSMWTTYHRTAMGSAWMRIPLFIM
jgi:hypothetical protein